MLVLGFCIGVIFVMIMAIAWGHRLSIKEEELSREIIKDFQDRLVENQEQKFYKRYES